MGERFSVLSGILIFLEEGTVFSVLVPICVCLGVGIGYSRHLIYFCVELLNIFQNISLVILQIGEHAVQLFFFSLKLFLFLLGLRQTAAEALAQEKAALDKLESRKKKEIDIYNENVLFF